MSDKWNQPRDGETWAEFEIRKQHEKEEPRPEEVVEEPFLEETVEEEPAPPPPKKVVKRKHKPPPPTARETHPYKRWSTEPVAEEDKAK